MSDSLPLHGLYSSWNSAGQNSGVGSHSLFQGIFPTQVSHIAGRFFTSGPCKRSPRILERVAYPFSRGSCPLRNGTRVSCIARGFSSSWATREALYAEYIMLNAGLNESKGGIKVAKRNINNLRYEDNTTLMAKSEEELKSLLMKEKEDSKKLA